MFISIVTKTVARIQNFLFMKILEKLVRISRQSHRSYSVHLSKIDEMRLIRGISSHPLESRRSLSGTAGFRKDSAYNDNAESKTEIVSFLLVRLPINFVVYLNI